MYVCFGDVQISRGLYWSSSASFHSLETSSLSTLSALLSTYVFCPIYSTIPKVEQAFCLTGLVALGLDFDRVRVAYGVS